jgi:hypothetical protein
VCPYLRLSGLGDLAGGSIRPRATTDGSRNGRTGSLLLLCRLRRNTLGKGRLLSIRAHRGE